MIKKNGERVYLSLGDYIGLGSILIFIIGLLISLKVDVASSKEKIIQIEANNSSQQKINTDQQQFNDCVKNAFAVEFGKNVYFYDNKYIYRNDSTSKFNNSR